MGSVWYLKVVAVVVLTGGIWWAGCSPKKKRFPELQSNSACSDVSLFSEMALTGNYIFGVVKCITTSGGSMQAAYDLTRQLGVDGIDAIIDLVEDPLAGDTDEMPVLSAISAALDRGMYDGPTQVASFGERYGALQSLLNKTNPAGLVGLVLHLQESKQLDFFIDDGLALFSSFEGKSLQGAFVKIMADPELRQAVSRINDQLMSNPEVYGALADILTVTSSVPLSRVDQVRCRDHWLKQGPRGFGQGSCLNDGSRDEMGNGPQYFSELWQSLGESSRKRVVAALHTLALHFIETSPESRQRTFRQLRQLMAGLSRGNDNTIKPIIAILDRFAHTHTSDIKTLIELVETLNDETKVAVLEKKIGGSRLNRFMESVLIHGGDIPGCDLTLPGIKLGDDESNATVPLRLRAFLRQSTACQGQAPLVAAMAHELGITLGQAFQSPWQNPLSWQAPDPQLLKQLALKVVTHAKRELSKDRLYLWVQKLSTGPEAASALDRLLSRIASSEGLTPADVVKIDKWFASLSDNSGYLDPYLLEKLMGREVDRMSLLARQFKDLVPTAGGMKRWLENPTVDHGVKSVFLGLYEGGPGSQVIQNAVSQVMENPPQGFAHHNLVEISSVLADYRHYWQPGLLSANADSRLAVLGSPSVSIEVAPTGVAVAGGEPLGTAVAYTGLTGVGFGGWSRVLDEPHLLSKDIMPGRADAFTHWLGGPVLSDLNNQVTWQEALARVQEPDPAMVVDTRFLTTTPFSSQEFMALLMYYNQNFQSPLMVEAHGFTQPGSLMGHGALFGDNRDFRGFYALWSQLTSELREGTYTSEDFVAALVGPLGSSIPIPADITDGQVSWSRLESLSRGAKSLALLNLLQQPAVSNQLLSPQGIDDGVAARLAQAWLCSPLNSQEEASPCSSDGLWQSDLKDKFANQAMARWIMSDVKRLGKNPQLAPGLGTLAFQIRLNRSDMQDEDAIRSLLQVSGLVYMDGHSRSQLLQARAKNFWQDQASFLDVVKNVVATDLTQGSTYSEGLRAYSRRGGNDVKQILESIIDSYQEHVDAPLLVFLLDLAGDIAKNQEFVAMTVELLTGPHSLETAEMMGQMMPLATKVPLHDGFEWHWDATSRVSVDPGIQLVKHLLARESWRDVSLVGQIFAPEDFERGFTILFGKEGALSRLGSLDAQAATLERVTQGLLKWLSSQTHEGEIIDELDAAVDHIYNASWPESASQDFSLVVGALGYEGQSLRREATLPVSHSLGSVMEVVFDRLPRAFVRYQRWEKLQTVSDVWAGLSGTLDASDQEAQALLGLLADERLGFAGRQIWYEMLTEPESRQRLLTVLDILNRTDYQPWQKLNGDLADLMDSVNFLLGYGAQRMEWLGPHKELYQYSFMVLEDLSDLSNHKLHHNVELLDKWFSQEDGHE